MSRGTGSKTRQIAITIAYYCCYLALTVLSIIIGSAHSLVAIFICKKAPDSVLRLNTWRYGVLWTKLLALFTPLTVTGNDQPLPVPCILVLNHQSYFDPYCLGFLPPSIGGRVNFWVTSWPFSIPVFGLYMRTVGYIDIMKNSGEESIERSKRLLKQGVSIAVFPEGTRSTAGVLGKFRIGVFKLAMETGISIVPICISGLGAFAPKGRFLINKSQVCIKVLPPVMPAGYASEKPLPERSLSRAVHSLLQKAGNQAKCHTI